MKRRLAAILAADVVEYSRMMNYDDESTLLRLENFAKNRIFPTIRKHNGRLVKEMGDGYLVEFQSVSECVDCAVRWQRIARETARDTDPDMAIRFRIGINIGEVLYNKEDVFGDGVIIAARLETMAEPEGILVSGAVYDQLEKQTSYDFNDLGFRQLKNIPQPIRTFSVTENGEGAANSATSAWPFLADDRVQNPDTRGGCLCGEVQYEIWGAPAGVGYCHCRFCQLALGAPLNAWAAFDENLVKFLGEPAKVHRSSEIAQRGFCGNCGTSLFTLLTSSDGRQFYSIRVATLDDPENYPPTLHFGVESKLPWLEVKDDLPRIGTSDDPGLSSLWTSVGQPQSGPKLGTAASRVKRKTEE